ncbi:hypothetical protein [Streptococcus sp. DD13]|uniref:hypothetical protein n=1 Tax=Streptococcus sp. DD13 TaxID=1777881 RepID=UPI00079ABA1C|nr:hypothetical protein [Streptococcus sp. DD13]KXT78580.1 Substrate-specific component CbrT of putative cobalamin ECF transporter [Streptococcus sp. DD13]
MKKQKQQLRSLQYLTQIAMLAALAIVSRQVFAPYPNIKPITAIFLVTGLYMGYWPSFWVMAITMLITSFYLGFGVIVLWQIVSFGLVLGVWQLLAVKLHADTSKNTLIQMVIAGLLPYLYGGVIALPDSIYWQIPLPVYLLGNIPFDTYHGVSTFLFYPFIKSIFRRFYQ